MTRLGHAFKYISFVSNLFDKSFVARGELEVVLCRPERNDPRKAAGTVRRLSDRFADAAGSCTDLPQLGALLDDAARELGFHYFALLDHSSLDRRLHRIGADRQLSPNPGLANCWRAAMGSTIRCIWPAGAPTPASAGASSIRSSRSSAATSRSWRAAAISGLAAASPFPRTCRESRPRPARSRSAPALKCRLQHCTAPSWSGLMRCAPRGGCAICLRPDPGRGSAGARSSACASWQWARPTGRSRGPRPQHRDRASICETRARRL